MLQCVSYAAINLKGHVAQKNDIGEMCVECNNN